jgi:uncharacterized membrane protein YfcA
MSSIRREVVSWPLGLTLNFGFSDHFSQSSGIFVDLDLFHISAIALGAFGTGFFKSTLSTGIGMFLVPLMVLIWPTRFVMGLIAVHMLLSDYAVLRLFWKKWEWKFAKMVIPGFYIGIIAGATLLVKLPDYWIRKSIGIACLAFALYQAWAEMHPDNPAPAIGQKAGFGIGVVGGTVSGLTHSGGLVLSLYLLSQGVEKVQIVATIILTWLFVNPLKITTYFIGGLANWTIFGVAVLTMPLAFAGGWIGKKLLDRISQRTFNMSLLTLATIAAIRLLWE